MLMENNEVFIYEAAYIMLKQNFWDKSMTSALPYEKAAARILQAAGINSEALARAYMDEHDSSANKRSAEDLYTTLKTENKTEFFAALTDDELYLYHSGNYEISFEYGQNLARCFDFSSKSVLDIGGSSGGLVSGIKSRHTNVAGAVMDTGTACEVGRSICHNIQFITGNFFKPLHEIQAYDVIILSNILHDWDDSTCTRLLNNMKPVLSGVKYIIIHEDILDDGGMTPVETLMYGLRLCVNEPGGRQRTIGEIEGLLQTAGNRFKLEKQHGFPPLSAAVFHNMNS